MKILWISAIASTTFIYSVASVDAAVFTLYNANGTNPSSQGSLAPGALTSTGFPTLPSESQVAGGGVTLNTAANSAEYAGYSNYQPANPIAMTPASYFNPAIFQSSTLNQTTGYTITFTVRLDSSTVVDTSTAAAPRAAFSVIAVSSDKKGIEIGFRPMAIFSQSASFGIEAQTSSAIDTNIARDYTLTVFNDTYSLSSSGMPIINGGLQNYVFNPALSSPPLTFNPYTTSSFLFFGDDTGKASGSFTLGSVNLDTTPIPFEFSPTYGLLAIGTGLAIKNWRKKARDKIK